MMKILIIVNPISGKKKRNKYYNRIKSNLENLGYEVKIEFTTKENNARVIIENYKEDYDIVIACGGDGTLNEITQGLHSLNKSVPIGFIPCGTTNDYARSLKIPFNKEQLSKNIKNYFEKQIDLGIFNNRTFNYVATFGVFSKTSYNVSRKLKNAIGRFAYIISGIKEVFSIKKYKMRVTHDNELIEDDFVFGSVSNSHYVGGFNIFRNQDIKLDDGKFEVVLIKEPKNLFHTIGLVFKIIFGNFKDKCVYYFKTDKLHIESLTENCGWSIDGEFGGNSKVIDIRNEKKWSRYLVPIK